MANDLDYLQSLFAPFGDVSVRKMFGGVGVFCDGKIFAICDLEEFSVWLKADAVTRGAFEAAGLAPFTYAFDNGKTGTMSYYAAPEDFFDDEDTLRHWTALALEAAARAKTPARKKARAAPSKNTGMI